MTKPFLTCPKNWETSTLEPDPRGRVIVSVSSGGTPSTAVEEYWGGKIPWLTPKEICNGKKKIFISKTERQLSKKGLEKSGSKLYPKGTVMLTKRAPVGTVVVNTVPMATNQGFLNFRCGKDLDPLYLFFWLKANKTYLDTVANGSTYPEIYAGDLFEFIIGYPRIKEQKKIVKFLLSLELTTSLGEVLESTTEDLSKIDNIQEETTYLIKMKDALLLYVIAGKVRIRE